ncbi:MAG TPA: universal stress protein [Pirellulaceae bacterium]|nr:universal stress protein [Pirellulaceae bacterium]HMO93547.1 universal stress protein [Pirellulaceae bacterium]HMP70341.1 universal stress protein [Pirellulaceae bacterium]
MNELNFSRILLITDGSLLATTTEQTALNFALRFGSSVDVVDVIRKPYFGEKWIHTQIESTLATLAEEKHKHLNNVAKSFKDAGVSQVNLQILEGKSSIEIAKYVLQHNIDVVIRYRKGAASKRTGPVGQTAYQLLGSCPVPVLLVAPSSPVTPDRVLACVDVYDETSLNKKIVDMACFVKTDREEQPSLLYCWDWFGHEFLKHRMNAQEYEEITKRLEAEQRQKLRDLAVALNLNPDHPGVKLLFGSAQYAIPEYANQQKFDLVVMSTVAPRSLGNKLLGSTIDNTIQRLDCSLLAIKPDGFVSPVTT